MVGAPVEEMRINVPQCTDAMTPPVIGISFYEIQHYYICQGGSSRRRCLSVCLSVSNFVQQLLNGFA